MSTTVGRFSELYIYIWRKLKPKGIPLLLLRTYTSLCLHFSPTSASDGHSRFGDISSPRDCDLPGRVWLDHVHPSVVSNIIGRQTQIMDLWRKTTRTPWLVADRSKTDFIFVYPPLGWVTQQVYRFPPPGSSTWGRFRRESWTSPSSYFILPSSYCKPVYDQVHGFKYVFRGPWQEWDEADDF